MFSPIGRSIYRSASLNKGAVSGSYGVRSAVLSEFSSGNACSSCEIGWLGLVRSYLTSIGAGKQVVKSNVVKGFNSIFENLRLRRLFSGLAPKKKYENYYPKNKSKIPNTNGQKSDAKEKGA